MLLRGAARRTFHPKVELGGRHEAAAVTRDVLKAREVVGSISRQLAGGAATHVDAAAINHAARTLAAAGDAQFLAQAHEVQRAAAKQKLATVLPGQQATDRMEAALALGDVHAALAVLSAQFDGDAVPLTAGTFAVLIDLLGVANAAAPDWETVLGAAVDANVPLTHPAVHDALARRFASKSPLLAYLAYAWRLACAAPMTPSGYADLVLSLYARPKYTAVLNTLLTLPEVAKNRFHLLGLLENVAHLLQLDRRVWESDDAADDARGGDALPAGRLHLAAQMPPAEEVLPEWERALAAALTRVIARHAEAQGYPLESPLASLAVNCRASTHAGLVMRVLAEAHQTKHIRVLKEQHSHMAVYEQIIGRLEEWGRFEDVCCMWRITDYYCTMWRMHYNSAGQEAAPPTAAVPGVVIPVLRACAKLRLDDLALDVVSAVYASNVWIDVAMLNAIVVALPGMDGGIAIYRKLIATPNTHPNEQTLHALLEASLRHPCESARGPTACRTAERELRRPDPEWDAAVRAVFPDGAALATPAAPATRRPEAAAAGGRAGEGPGAGAGEDPFPYVLSEIKRLTYIIPDGRVQTLLVSNHLKRGDAAAAAAAAVAMVTSHYRPGHEELGAWRAAAAHSGACYSSFIACVDTALEAAGLRDRRVDNHPWARGNAPTEGRV
eukprot:TRINITY_DN20447_c0_g1_i1.p1 TRINITY_DN20447_c0_g1~~TRINITY_DN20447_c0_g1_i1.p1  ORF type:complete len:669 (+),score=192.56 TRINITY_DN20447_c0_g1_i1:177-2183(+)